MKYNLNQLVYLVRYDPNQHCWYCNFKKNYCITARHTIETETETTYAYTVTYDNDNKAYVPENLIFSSKKKAKAELLLRNCNIECRKLDDIKIPRNFIESIPAQHKIIARINDFYAKSLDTSRIILKNNILIDGYATYLVCKMFNVDEVEVKIYDARTV